MPKWHRVWIRRRQDDRWVELVVEHETRKYSLLLDGYPCFSSTSRYQCEQEAEAIMLKAQGVDHVT